MFQTIKKILLVVGVIFLVWFVTFVLDLVLTLSDLAARFSPALEPWVFWPLMLLVGLGFAWLIAVVFFRPKPMVVPTDPTAEELALFRSQLALRLSKNYYVSQAGIEPWAPEGMEQALTLLDERANREIKSTAKQVFLGTALSQNGKADALILFFSLARLIWVVSKIYNQRPHFRELYHLYLNVAASTLIASRIGDAEMETQVRIIIEPMLRHSAITMIPGAGKVLPVIMTSALDGGGSAFMVLRVGIIARNYMSLNLEPGRSARRMASLEAGKMFGEVSVGTVTSIATALVTATGGIIYKGAARAAGLTADAATSSGSALAGGAKTALTGVGGAGKKSATVLAKAVRTTGNLLAKNAITLGTIAGKNLGTGVRAAALGAKNGAGFVVGKMKGLVRRKRDEA